VAGYTDTDTAGHKNRIRQRPRNTSERELEGNWALEARNRSVIQFNNLISQSSRYRVQ